MLRVIFLLLLTDALSFAAGTLKVRIFDADHHTITAARVNVIGSDNAFYEPDPARNPLSDYSLKRKGNRGNVTPLRYFGSFFYTAGAFEIQLPPGVARIEVTKGYAYYQALAEAKIEEGKTSNYDVNLQRVIDMPPSGWHSTDTHLHFDRGDAEADSAILQLLSAEDIELGHILTTRSSKGWGLGSVNTQGRYSIVSGRESTSAGLGHVNLLLFNDLPAALRIGPARPGFPLASIYDQVVAAGGAMQHDHAGYGQEIYADAVLGKSDAVELIQFGLYRPEIGIDGYYLLLNSGFRFPLLGASDYPVCRTMSDSRTFVADGPTSGFPSAVGRLLRGQSFATSGPLLFLSVNGKGPGSDLVMSATQPVAVRVVAASGELPFDTLEIVQDGRIASQWHGTEPVFQKEIKTTLTLNASSWIAARCSGPNTVHAHTNPVWIYVNGRTPFQPEAVRQVQARIRSFKDSNVSEAAKSVADDAQNKLDSILRAGDPPLRTPELTRFPVSAANVSLSPPVLPRPRPLSPVTLEGSVADKSGRPLSGVSISVRAVGSPVTTRADGTFVIHNVDGNLPLFLRLSKLGYATTNTAYLNPRTPKEQLRIVMPPPAEHRPQATIFIDGAAPGTVFTSSPAGTTHFGPDGIATSEIKFQPAYPAPGNGQEPNVIVSADGWGKDIVMPVFADQVTYARVSPQAGYAKH
jgi:hypothetical protein